jgi:ADP-ribose pyrophosphatase YjhB (NUDIX family)
METTSLSHLSSTRLEQLPLSDLSKTDVRDYVNMLVLNEAGDALVLEGHKQDSGGIYWQLLGCYLEPEEDPFTAVQRHLLQKVGYQTTHWSYLGTHGTEVNRLIGVRHSFCARNARQVAKVEKDESETHAIKWIPLTTLRYALQDGRLPITSHALTVSLALLTVLK